MNVEKNRQNNSTIRSVYNDQGELVYSPSLILQEITSFYKKLLNPDSNVSDEPQQTFNDFIKDTNHPKIDDAQKDFMDSLLDINEFKTALLTLNKDSSTGIDGLSPLFFINFWDQLKEPLFECFLESIKNKMLPLTQRRALLSLIPKGSNLDLNILSNWRPISVLCTDYKIFSRVLATRLETVLEKLIHPNQAGYVRGRSISDHLRLVDDVINCTNHESITGILTSLDFRKAFDTISKDSIIAALHAYNFGPRFIQYVSTILNGTQTCVKNGGWLSSFFETQRGVRQGCVISPLLFILVVEFLAVRIREDPEIVGILELTPRFAGGNLKCLLYADDINLLLKNLPSLIRTIKITVAFGSVTGLGLNRIKCVCLCLGGLIIANPSTEGLTWLNRDDNIKVLGVYFNAHIEASLIHENHVLKTSEIKDVIINWSRRNVSLMGKCLLTKLFMLSKLNNVMQPLSIPSLVLESIDQLLFGFLWSNNPFNKRVAERVKRDTLCLPIEEGGIGMISVCDQQKVMLISWLKKRSLINNPTHLKIVNYFCRSLGGIHYISKCNANVSQFSNLNAIKSMFWRDVIKAWAGLDKSDFCHSQANHETPIFYNSNVVYKGNTLHITKWIMEGPRFVEQLFDNDRFKSLDEIKTIIPNYAGLVFDYNAVKTAVLSYKTKLLNNNASSEPDLSIIPQLQNKVLRKMLVKQKPGAKNLTCISTWKNKMNFNVEPFFNTAKLCTKEPRLIGLHFKIVHNIFNSNYLLFKQKIKPSPFCDRCNIIETTEHCLVDCPKLKDLWSVVKGLIEIILDDEINLLPENILFGINNNFATGDRKQIAEVNRLLLVAKACILKQRAFPNANLLCLLDKEVKLRTKLFPTILK